MSDEILSVGEFLTRVNSTLKGFRVKVFGEITSVDIRGTYIFFSIKDKEDESLLSCFMWQRALQLSGIQLAVGTVVAVTGSPSVYKKFGRFTFETLSVELVGEGALQKAYEELKKKLTSEGVFALEKKRVIPDFPVRIGLITSSTGAVIHDFLNNLGRRGFQIYFRDSRVEGQSAVSDLVAAVDFFKKKPIDVLVIIRGGGSLESLQAFNNEVLVRRIASFPRPVIAGIGHDKDVPLLALAADAAPSTPTAVAHLISESWDVAEGQVQAFQSTVFSRYQSSLEATKRTISSGHVRIVSFGQKYANALGAYISRLLEKQGVLNGNFSLVRQEIMRIEEKVKTYMEEGIRNTKRDFEDQKSGLGTRISLWIRNAKDRFEKYEQELLSLDPARFFKLGWALARGQKGIVASKNDVKVGESVSVQVVDGVLETKVSRVI